jgi:IS30 family transposase
LPYLEPFVNTEFLYQKLFKNEEFLRRKYLEERLSTAQIAAQIFAVRSTVAKYLKRFGIPLRSEDEAHGLNKGQLAYGEKRRSNKVSDHQRELRTLARIRELRELGHSYHAIAAILTAMGVPTKTRGAHWHATTVMKILKRAELS